MIGFIKGRVHALGSDQILVDHDGIGFRINFNRPERLKIDEEVTIYTYQNVREDEISLFGFLSLREYELFVKLITVKGLGPKIASGILAKASVDDILTAIETNDVDFMRRMPGVGAKTASQIILDLKGKLVENSVSADNEEMTAARDALRALGYKSSEFSNILKEVARTQKTSDAMIKETLKLLAKK